MLEWFEFSRSETLARPEAFRREELREGTASEKAVSFTASGMRAARAPPASKASERSI